MDSGEVGVVNGWLRHELGIGVMDNQSLSLNVIKSIRSVSAGTKA